MKASMGKSLGEASGKSNKPTPQLIDWANMEFGVLIHFDIEVFDPKWVHITNGKLNPPPDIQVFNPAQLDTDQWIQVVKASGAKYAVLTAKHVTGFTLFPDPEYAYAVDKTPYLNGQGDIIKSFVASCRKYGIKPGLYYSCEANSFLNIHKSSGNMPRYPSPEWDYFTTLVTRHLIKLWSEYGDLCEIWFDGGVLEHGPDYLGLLQKFQPNAITFQGPEGHPHRIRWVGNERGLAPYPCWATIDSTDAYDGTQEIGDKNKGDPNGMRWIPAETDVPLRFMQWMWFPYQDGLAASPGYIMKWYYESVGRNTNLLLGLVVDNRGLIPSFDGDIVGEFGQCLKKRFEKPVASVSGDTSILEIRSTNPIEFNTIELMEDIAQGHCVREFAVETSDDGKKWAELLTGAAIGHRYLTWVPNQKVKNVRLHLKKTVGSPKILRFALYSAEALDDEFES